MKNVKNIRSSQIIFWLGVFLLTAVSRFAFITNKPIHFDEGINGWFVMQMDSLGYYKYDPNNYHGPFYFYLLHFFEYLFPRSLETLRAVPAVFSVLSVMLFSAGILRNIFVERLLGIFLLFSPAFIFFGRSGIHEMPFVFFQLLGVLGLLRWLKISDAKALALLFIGLAGMLCLKETFIISLFSGLVALLSLGWKGNREVFQFAKIRSAWNIRLSLLCLLLIFIIIALFTGGFRNPQGLTDFFKSFFPWLKTGSHGNGHEKSFTYWVEVLLVAEPLVLLGVLLAIPGALARNQDLRVLSVFSLVQFLVYSLIPYKTVWCVLSLVWGFYFVIALTVQRLFKAGLRSRWSLAILLAVFSIYGLRSVWLSSYRVPLDLAHPYFYVNSTYDLSRLADKIKTSLEDRPQLKDQYIQIGMDEQWPWPWVLRDAKNLIYESCGKQAWKDALVYFCEPEDSSKIEALLTTSYWKVSVVLRQERGPNVIYFKESEFDMSETEDSVELVKAVGEVNP